MALNWLVPVRAAQFVFAIVALGLSAHLVALLDNIVYDGYVISINSSRLNFNVFESLFTILCLIYLIGILFVFKETSFAHPVFSVVLDGLNWIFWLAAFACIAALLDGATNTGEFGALVAFGVLEWLLFSVTLTFGIIAFLRGRSGKGSTTGTTTTTGPVQQGV